MIYTITVYTLDGYAILASFPPFTRDKYFRIVFNSCIVAPLLARIFITHSLSWREIGGLGAHSNADPPKNYKFT